MRQGVVKIAWKARRHAEDLDTATNDPLEMATVLGANGGAEVKVGIRAKAEGAPDRSGNNVQLATTTSRVARKDDRVKAVGVEDGGDAAELVLLVPLVVLVAGDDRDVDEVARNGGSEGCEEEEGKGHEKAGAFVHSAKVSPDVSADETSAVRAHRTGRQASF